MRATSREKFSRGLDKSRTINFMKDSLKPAPVPHAFDFGYIQDARQRIEVTRSSEVHPVEAPTVGELGKALGEPVQNFHLFAKNWRNRIYRIELVSGHVALAKQVIVGTDEMLRYQYDQLQALATFQIPGLRVPRGLGILPQKRVYLMEFAQGKPISHLIWNQASEGDLLPACQLAGKIIAQLQIARTEKIAPMPVESLARDFETAPWHLSSREENVLQAVLEVWLSCESAWAGFTVITQRRICCSVIMSSFWWIRPVGCGRARIFGTLPFSAVLCDATYGILLYGDRSIEGVQSLRKVWLPSTAAISAAQPNDLVNLPFSHWRRGFLNCSAPPFQ